MRWRRVRDPLQCMRTSSAPSAEALTGESGEERGWLLRDGSVLASLEIPASRQGRALGLIGRDSIQGAMLLCKVRSVHSFGMRFDLDVAYVDVNGLVVRTLRLPRNRIAPPVWRAHYVLECEVGSFGRWGLSVGDELEFRR